MPARSVLGSSPVIGVTAAGAQYSIPLILLGLKDDGSFDTSRAGAVAGEATATIQLLSRTGALGAGAEPAPLPALVLTAQTPGLAGNTVTVALANVHPDAATPADGTVDATVTAEDRRMGLTPATAGEQLGTPGGGTVPGLVQLEAAATKLPAATPATKLAGTPPKLAIPANSGSGNALKLVAAGADPLFADVSVAVEDVDDEAGTFTLVIGLDHLATGVKLGDLDAALSPLVDVAPGPDGYTPPAEGSVTLTGGTAPQTTAAAAAHAIVLPS